MAERDEGAEGWLLLIHQVPPKPNYFRVKIWRRLQRLGAVAIKNSVYALPRSDAAQEDLQWVLREITEGGGDGSVCEARFVEGLADDQIRALFHAARDAEYAALAEEARALWDKMPPDSHAPAERVAELGAQIARLRRRLGEVAEIDFFGAAGRESAEGLIGELRFDMFAAEFTHEGDRCTFEVLIDRFGLRDRPLQAIAEIVHDIDLKDGKFRRQEALGIDRLVAGIAMAHAEDAARIAAASTVWDGLHEYFRRKRA